MVKAKREFIVFSTLTSAGATILGLIALSTSNWVNSDAVINVNTTTINELPSSVSYGFFEGVYTQVLGGTTDYKLRMTCDVNLNICALMCAVHSYERRKEELQMLYNETDITLTCSSSRVGTEEIKFEEKLGALRADSSRKFINAGVYISTILFLCIAVLFGIVATTLGVWNILDNPIEIWFSIFGMFISNGIACVAAFLTLMLWGILFGVTLVNNVCFFFSISGEINTDGLAALGYSYWLILPMTVLFGLSIIFLWLRRYFLDMEPKIVLHSTDRQDISNAITF